MQEAIQLDDRSLVCELANAGVSLAEKICGGSPVQYALGRNKYQALQVLLELKAPLEKTILRDITDAVPPEAMRALIQSGAEISVDAIIKCASAGALESARILAANYPAQLNLQERFAESKQEAMASLQRDIEEVQSGILIHYLGEEGLTKSLANLKEFEL